MRLIHKIAAGCFCILTLVLSAEVAFEKTGTRDKFTVNSDMSYGTTPLFKTHQAWVYGPYVLERQTTLKMYSSTQIDPENGTQTEGKSYSEEVFTAYNLTNTHNRKCYNYVDSSLSNPRVKSVATVSEKKVGFQFKDENDPLSVYINRFRVLKDTVIGRKPVTLLVCDFKDKPNDRYMVKIVLYLDKNLKGLPFYLESKALDKKFNGTVFRMSAFYPDGKSMNVDYDIKPGLSREMEAAMKKFIAAANL